MTEVSKCELCGEPMPEGEQMFKYHGYSGPCPKPPLAKPPGLNFSAALMYLKEGRRVARAGWNGKGMWLILIEPGNAMHTGRGGGAYPMQRCIGMKTFENNMQPGWLASQADLLAEDWSVIPD